MSFHRDASINSPNTPEPAPQPGSAIPTVDLVIADFQERKQMGAAKYGIAHQFDNGRDHLVDFYQELQDAVVYVRAEIEKRKFTRNEVLEEVARVLDQQGATSVAQEYASLYAAMIRRMKQEPVAVQRAGVWVPGSLSVHGACRICGSMAPINREGRCLECFSKL